MRLPTSAFKSMIDSVPIDSAIALANDDAAGSAVTAPLKLRARSSAHTHASTSAGQEIGAYSCWLFAYAHTQYMVSSHESSSPAM